MKSNKIYSIHTTGGRPSPAAIAMVGTKWAVFGASILAILLLSGCYELDNEVIRAQDAVRIPPACCTDWVPDELHKGHTMTLRAIPGGNDYHYQSRDENSEMIDCGVVRFASLTGDIYITQYVSDEVNEVGIEDIAVTFYRMTTNGKVWEVEVADDTDLNALAARYGALFGVTIGGYKYLNGPRESKMAFLKAHRNVKFVEVKADVNAPRAFRKAEQHKQLESEAPQNARLPGERYPVTRTKLLSPEEVARWSYAEIRYAINEMFARHGGSFSDAAISAVFAGKSWYQPKPERSFDEIEQDFSEIEKANVKKLGAARNLKQGR